jgi:hypothetical protein
MMKDVTRILKSGSKLFRKYLALQEGERNADSNSDGLLDAIQHNSVLRNLTAMQKRNLESLAEGPRFFHSQSLLWKVGDPVDYAYIIVGGSAMLGRKLAIRMTHSRMNRRGSTGGLGNSLISIDEQGSQDRAFQPIIQIEADKALQNVHPNSEYARLEVGLQHRADEMEASMAAMETIEGYGGRSIMLPRDEAGQSPRDRFANKVLARLYSRKAYTENLIFSRGNFLSDTSRMVSGDLANINKSAGMGSHRSSIGATIGDHHCHTSNLIAGPEGVVVMVFHRSTLVPFLDSNPGVLLCLLGTQVVV